jgi:hypothetical protein
VEEGVGIPLPEKQHTLVRAHVRDTKWVSLAQSGTVASGYFFSANLDKPKTFT